MARAILPHLDAAYGLARWLVRDADAARDVVQESCLRAIQYFSGFRGGNARAWLLGIVRNAARDRLRGTGEAPLTEDAALEVPDPAPGPEASYARKQDMARLEAALAALPLDLRECLVLRELEQLSYQEIARVTEVPVGTVMSRLWRARQLLLRPREGE